MKWITRDKVNVDRIACPSVGKKFIGPEAEFISLPPDINSGEVSFDAILEKYGLTDTDFALLAQIVRASDSHPSSPHAAGKGLRWIAQGFRALGLSDLDIVERECIVYDAPLAERRRRVAP